MACASQTRVRVLVLIAGLVALLPLGVAAGDEAYHTRIPHRDGSGRATIVELDAGVPGAKAFVRDEERPAPAPGELSLASPAPRPSPSR